MSEDLRSQKDAHDQELLLKARSGDHQAMETLLNRYKLLVRQKASAMFMLGADSEDVIQEGMIGLFKAIRTYQADQGAAFATFANRCITSQITDAVRQASRQKHRPLNESLSLQNLLVHDLKDQLGEEREIPAPELDPEQVLLFEEENERLKDDLKQLLSEFEQQVIRLYLQGKRYREIADVLNCSSKRVDNALTRIRQKLIKNRRNSA